MSRFAIAGARVLPVVHPPVDPGVVLVEEGKIQEIRPGDQAPEGWSVVDGRSCVVTPGLVEAHCHVGLSELGTGPAGQDGNELSLPVGAELRALDGVNPMDDGFEQAREAGITTLCIVPGSSDPVGGEAVILKARPERSVDEMAVGRGGGIKMALGENPKNQGRQRNRTPMTRMAIAAQIRQALLDGYHYHQDQKEARKGGKNFRRDLRLETLARVAHRRVPARMHAHRGDDVATALRLAEELQFDLVLEHGTGAVPLAEHLAYRNVPVVFGPALASGVKVETRGRRVSDALGLIRAGVRVAFTTDAPVTPLMALRISAILAVAEGLDPETALAAITHTPAAILRLDGRLGGLAPDMDADLALFSGDPLDLRSHVLATWIDGEPVYRRPTALTSG